MKKARNFRKALYKEGGIYLDLDSELIAPIDRLPDGEWVAGEQTASGGVWMAAGAGLSLSKGSTAARYMLDAYAGLNFDSKRAMMPPSRSTRNFVKFHLM